jgi:16S rRNA (guanine527-N7)-methyltransferase
VFHVEHLPLLERYAALLADAGTVRGLIGPREVPRLWDRHLLNCGVLAGVLPDGATVADVGSGAGLPGLVLAIARPDLQLTLIEPLMRRTTFLTEVVADLGLPNVEVVRGRAETLHGARTFDVVTSRAVASLAVLLDWSMPLVAPNGELVAMKGSSAVDEVAAARASLDRWGCAAPRIEVLGSEVLPTPTTMVRISWSDRPRAERVARADERSAEKTRRAAARPRSTARRGGRGR